MHILLLSQYFPPETGALAARAGDHVRRWVAAGARVTVLAGIPNYPTGSVAPGYRRRLYVREPWRGADVIRVPVVPTHYGSVPRRIASYLSYAASAALAGLIRELDPPDIVLGTSPPLTAALPAEWIARRFDVPFVLELRDPWPEAIEALDARVPPWAVASLRRLADRLRGRADRVVVVTEAMRQGLVDAGAVPEQLSVVPNGVDIRRFRPLPSTGALRSRLGIAGGLLVGHVGTIGLGQDLETFVRVLAQFPQSSGIRAVFVGSGARRSKLETLAQDVAPDRVRFLDPVPYGEVPHMLAELDVALVSSSWAEHLAQTVPAKLYDAMACGCPVLMAGHGVGAELVRLTGCGLTVPPGEPAPLTAALTRLMHEPELRVQMGAAGPPFVRRHHDRDRLAAEMLELLCNVRDSFSSSAREHRSPGGPC